jgi:hypothetical protein
LRQATRIASFPVRHPTAESPEDLAGCADSIKNAGFAVDS